MGSSPISFSTATHSHFNSEGSAMYRSLILFWITLGLPFVSATKQDPDHIIYKGETCELETHWIFPSPLQLYFMQLKKESPFGMLTTANYRGHIATWEIEKKQLFLNKISFGESGPDPFAIHPKEGWMKNLFPKKLDEKGRVPATWFSGNLRIYSHPVTRRYQREGEEEFHEQTSFSKIAIVQLEKGKVTSEELFDIDDYWAAFHIIQSARSLDEKRRKAVEQHIAFMDKHTDGWDEPVGVEPKGPFHSEEDFSVFLTRQFTRQVRIPLTDFNIVKNATLDFSDRGYVIETDLRIAKGKHLLFLEMGGVKVPRGPWSGKTGGSVQVVLQLESLEGQLEFTEKNQDILRLINNFAGALNPKKTVQGNLQLKRSNQDQLAIAGSIKLRSKQPTTYQSFDFKEDIIPVRSIEEYVTRRYQGSKEAKERAKEILERIQSESQQSMEN